MSLATRLLNEAIRQRGSSCASPSVTPRHSGAAFSLCADERSAIESSLEQSNISLPNNKKNAIGNSRGHTFSADSSRSVRSFTNFGEDKSGAAVPSLSIAQLEYVLSSPWGQKGTFLDKWLMGRPSRNFADSPGHDGSAAQSQATEEGNFSAAQYNERSIGEVSVARILGRVLSSNALVISSRTRHRKTDDNEFGSSISRRDGNNKGEPSCELMGDDPSYIITTISDGTGVVDLYHRVYPLGGSDTFIPSDPDGSLGAFELPSGNIDISRSGQLLVKKRTTSTGWGPGGFSSTESSIIVGADAKQFNTSANGFPVPGNYLPLSLHDGAMASDAMSDAPGAESYSMFSSTLDNMNHLMSDINSEMMHGDNSCLSTSAKSKSESDSILCNNKSPFFTASIHGPPYRVGDYIAATVTTLRDKSVLLPKTCMKRKREDDKNQNINTDSNSAKSPQKVNDSRSLKIALLNSINSYGLHDNNETLSVNFLSGVAGQLAAPKARVCCVHSYVIEDTSFIPYHFLSVMAESRKTKSVHSFIKDC